MSSSLDLRNRFLRLAALNVLATVATPLASLVDTAMLGHLPDIRFLAGVALAGLIFDYVYWTCGFLRMSVTGTTAQALGRGDPPEAHRILWRALVLAGVLAAALLALRGPLEELGFALFSGDAGAESAGRDYYGARIWAAPAAMANLVFLGWFLGRAEGRLVLTMTVVGSVANVAFNYVFIVRLGLAARGAGLGTLLAEYLTLAVAVARYLPRRLELPTWPEILHRERLLALLRLQLDILIRTLCLVTSFAAFVNLSAVLGTAILAANTLLLRILTLAAYLVDGAAFATESLAGLELGRRDAGALGRLLRLAMTTGVLGASLLALPLLLAPRALLGLLTSHDDVIALAAAHRGWLAATLVAGAVAFIYDGYFLGLTAGRTLRNAMLISTLGVFVPLALVALRQGSSELLWLAFLAFMVARAVTLGRAVQRH